MKHTRDRRARQRIFALLALLALLASVACGKDDTTKVDPNDFGELQQSTKNRVTDPNVAPADLDALTDGNNLFAWKLYRELKKGGTNLFYSPYSISTALAMTFAGAKGTTKSEMAATLAVG